MRWRPSWRDEGREPDSRFSMANERTYLAWVRTALAAMAASVAVLKLGPGGHVAWLRHALAVTLGALGLIVGAGTYAQWRSTEQAIRADRPLPHSPLLPLLAFGLVIIGAGVLILVITG